MSFPELPNTWLWDTLGNHVSIRQNKVNPQQSPEKLFFSVGLEHIERHTGKLLNVPLVKGYKIKSIKNKFYTSDVLYGKLRPNLNKVVLVGREGICSTDILVLICESSLLPEFLQFYLRSALVLGRMEKLAVGGQLPRVNSSDFLKLPLPVPPLEEQQYIVEILQQADELRCLRQDLLANVGNLTSALFLEMFGDPMMNSMGWNDLSNLDAKADIVSGVTKGQKSSRKITREISYLAVANVQDKYLNLGDVKTIFATEDEIEKYRLRVNDLLLTEGGDPDKLGRGALWGGEIDECIHQNHVFRVRLKSPDLNPIFLKFLVASSRGKSYFLRVAKQTTGIASINMSQLKAFSLLIPPLTLQELFANRVSEIESYEAQLRKHLLNLNSLLATLQSQAFTGKLTENWRVLHGNINAKRIKGVVIKIPEETVIFHRKSLFPVQEQRKAIYEQLSRFQRIVWNYFLETEGYVVDDLPTLIAELPDEITTNDQARLRTTLATLTKLGLVAKVSLPDSEGNYIPVYRALRESDERREYKEQSVREEQDFRVKLTKAEW